MKKRFDVIETNVKNTMGRTFEQEGSFEENKNKNKLIVTIRDI